MVGMAGMVGVAGVAIGFGVYSTPIRSRTRILLVRRNEYSHNTWVLCQVLYYPAHTTLAMLEVLWLQRDLAPRLHQDNSALSSSGERSSVNTLFKCTLKVVGVIGVGDVVGG